MNSKFKIKNTGDYSPFVKKVINGRDFKACGKNSQATPHHLVKCYNASYFEAGRRLRVRSILGVCEQPEIKPDAKRAVLEYFQK